MVYGKDTNVCSSPNLSLYSVVEVHPDAYGSRQDHDTVPGEISNSSDHKNPEGQSDAKTQGRCIDIQGEVMGSKQTRVWIAKETD